MPLSVHAEDAETSRFFCDGLPFAAAVATTGCVFCMGVAGSMFCAGNVMPLVFQFCAGPVAEARQSSAATAMAFCEKPDITNELYRPAELRARSPWAILSACLRELHFFCGFGPEVVPSVFGFLLLP